MGEVGADWMPWFDVLFRSFGKTFGGTFTFLPIAARFHTSMNCGIYRAIGKNG